MDSLKIFQYLVGAVSLVIGLFMGFQYYDSALPPALSGVVFTLLGVLKVLELQDNIET